MKKRIFLIFLGLIGTAQIGVVSADLFGPSLEEQRQNYFAAEQALRKRQYGQFQVILKKLDGYILHGYLEYQYLKNRITTTPKETLARFVELNKDTVFGASLREKWLKHLAKKNDWDRFIQIYDHSENDSQLRCYYLRYQIGKEGLNSSITSQIKPLWLTARKTHSACQPVFDAWRRGGYMTEDLVWQRIKLAMEKGRLNFATELGQYLNKKNRTWLERWKKMYRHYNRELYDFNYPVDTPVARMIIRHGIMRLGRYDPQKAMEVWQDLKSRYQFYGEDDDYVLRWLGIYAASNRLPEALDWLSSVSVGENDSNLRIWRLKAALNAGAWETAKHFIANLTELEQGDRQWLYWQARVYEHTEEVDQAMEIYTRLAKFRDYYGFLAADRVNAEYSVVHESIEVTPEEVSAMLGRRDIQIAQELYMIGNQAAARKQWNWTIENFAPRQLEVAAVIARHWGWHDRAIYTVNKSPHRDDLELRFPIAYLDLVQENAEQMDIDPGWIYGVIRQESAFIADARSPAGALGLMQLMPKTGRMTGRSLKIRVRNKYTLIDIENNLKIGAAYLKHVLKRYKGHQVLATASYNAGPNKVKRWLPKTGEMDSDIWVENIPYRETRNYVKNVMAYTVVYDHRLDIKRPARLQERMPKIQPLK